MDRIYSAKEKHQRGGPGASALADTGRVGKGLPLRLPEAAPPCG